jgi:hypothetical protein
LNKVFLDIETPAPVKNITGVNDIAINYVKENPIIPIVIVGLVGITLYLIFKNNELEKSFGVTNGQAAAVARMGI